MSTIKTVVVLALLALTAALVVVPLLVKADPTPEIKVVTVEVTQPTLSPAQIIWFARLMQCESGLKASAVNPNDLDNTPSYGILQFKPGTFAQGVKDFGLSTTTTYMDANTQVAIVEQWILRGGVNWHHQFPACTTKLGLPPTQ